ncbi:unnamed protein product [Vitrella brassicaformis CCMP3155]|uniref:PCI domain-containing protein n=2 Tax=Vitrella brassicaformis TaxID=1169539 RepID=A0A0G4GTU2_VITBC|nr:unnamed protein product [Vitrella brassicaformis CCMP3155]|eukprot:CEM34150.1 unnamed protein product [Vitrella brassicaformis CCMP3155]
MDSLDTSAVEQFILLGKTVKGKALEALITQVLEHPGVFTFGELLELPSIKEYEKSSPEAHKQVALLKLFAYGTLEEYKARRELFPAADLSPAMYRKLRMLTVTSMASNSTLLTFDALATALDLEPGNTRQLENIIIETIYAELVEGKMDQEKQCFAVSGVASRDVRLPQDLDDMIDILGKWGKATEQVLKSLNDRLTDDSKERQKFLAEEKNVKDEVEKVKTKLKGETDSDMVLGGLGGMGLGGLGRVDDLLVGGPEDDSKRQRGAGQLDRGGRKGGIFGFLQGGQRG